MFVSGGVFAANVAHELRQLESLGCFMAAKPRDFEIERFRGVIEMGVSKNSGTPKSSHFNRVFHEINHPFWGFSPYFWFNTQISKSQAMWICLVENRLAKKSKVGVGRQANIARNLW